MKKTAKILIFILFVIALVAVTFACTEKGEYTRLELKKADVSVGLGERYDLMQCFSVEGNGKIYFTVESDCLDIKDGYLYGAKVGSGIVTYSSGSYSGKINVTVYDRYEANVVLSDVTCDYDGGIKNVTVSGRYPEGTVIKYYCEGEEFFGAKMPGEYVITAEAVLPEKYHLRQEINTATLVINRLYFNLNLTFSPKTVEYDGEEHSITVEGELPDGVTPSYENNVGTNAGNYYAKVNFLLDEDIADIYEPIRPMTALLTIKKKGYDSSVYDVNAIRVTYDGESNFRGITPTEGIEVTYYGYFGSSYIPLDEYVEKKGDRVFIDSGKHDIKAVFSAKEGYEDNYAVPDAVNYLFEIKKADFTSTLRWITPTEGHDAVYDGTPKVFSYSADGAGIEYGLIGTTSGVNGEYPEGAKVTFKYNGQSGDSFSFVDAGKYTVTATFSMPSGSEKNYNPLAERKYAFVIDKAPYGITFGYDDSELADQRIVYDGEERVFALTFANETEKAKFLSDVKVVYYINRNGMGNQFVGMENGSIVKNAGAYVVGYNLYFRDPVDGDTSDIEYIAKLKNNYRLPSNYSFSTEITKKSISVDGVTLNNETFTYDGSTRTVLIEGALPDGVTVTYRDNEVKNAGVYTVSATFGVANDLVTNFLFLRGGKEITRLTCTVTVNKGVYNKSDLPTVEALSGVYDENKTLLDYPLPENFRWENPTKTPVCNLSLYSAIYNADVDNYEDISLYVTLTLSKKTVDATSVTVRGDFLPYVNDSTIVYPITVGTGAEYFAVTASCDTDGISLGTHLFYDVNIVLKDDVNFIATNVGTSPDVTVTVYDGSLYKYDGSTLVKYLGLQSTVNILEGTTAVRQNAFDGCTTVEKLTLPSTIATLSTNAFVGMDVLTEMTLPYIGLTRNDGRSFSSVFNGMVPSSLRIVTVTEDNSIPNGAYLNCDRIERIVYTEDISAIGESAFSGCANLISVGNKVENKYLLTDATIGQYAFLGCVSLTELYLREFTNVTHLFGTNGGDNKYVNYSLAVLDLTCAEFTSVEDGAFAGLVSLTSLVLPATAVAFGNKCFENLSAKITFLGDFDTVANGMFYGYYGTTVSLPDTVTSIGRDGFANARYLVSITLPSGVNEIGEYAFRNVTAPIIFSGNSYTAVESYAFAEYAGNVLTLPSSVNAIDSYAFAGAKIKSFSIDNVALGNNIFDGCTELTTVTFSGGILPSATFQGCISLKSVTLNGVEEIRGNAFFGCTALTEIIIPDTVSSIGSGTFSGCDSLATIVFHGNMPSFSTEVFSSAIYINIYVKSDQKTSFEETLRIYPKVNIYAK